MDFRDLSTQIRRHRRGAGLSLSQLARRADTSAATLSRYEGGWGRFELYTLRKLATALGCRLTVRLERIRREPRKPSRRAAVRQLRRLFWDRRLEESDLDEHPEWVVERVLDYGELEDVHLLVDLLGRAAFLDHVSRARFQSAKTREFWLRILEREGVPCTRRSFPREAWIS